MARKLYEKISGTKQMKKRKNVRVEYLSSNPQNIKEPGYDLAMWYYEEKRGIMVVHEVRNGHAYFRTDQFIIPWKMLKETMKRYEKSLTPPTK